MAAFERREGHAWEKVTQLDDADASDRQESSGNQAVDPVASTQQGENPQTCITEEAEWDNMPAASASAGCVQVNENGGMDVKVKVKVTGIRVVYDPGEAQDAEPAEIFASEEKTADNAAGMTQEKCENETPDPEIVIHKINIVKKEAIDENVSVSRSGRIYSEEQLRQQIRK